MTNLRIWDELKKTDPEQTKRFDRAGGFKGTAIKPIYTVQRMTEKFGPCGFGWGFTEPRFQVERVGETALVFCTLGVWYTEGELRSEPVYGTGGDNLTLSRKDGPKPNDEAFKAAQTDALSNAMKFIGMGADVHMGLHDDDKYVRALTAELHPPANRAASPASAPTTGAYKVTGLSKEAGAPGFATAMDTLLRKAKSGAELDAILADNREAMERLAGAFPDLRADILKTFEQAWSRFDPALMP